jgi:hypothetical protein
MGRHWRDRDFTERDRTFNATTQRTLAIVAIAGMAVMVALALVLN